MAHLDNVSAHALWAMVSNWYWVMYTYSQPKSEEAPEWVETLSKWAV